MDLSSPLRSLIPSLDSAVLEILAATESGLSGSAIARLAPRGSRRGQATVLDRLVAHGLVIADPANQGFLYRLNRHHVLTPAVLAAVSARAEVLRRMAAGLASFTPEPSHASIFGSFARRQGSEDSDIDLLVIVADDVDPYHPGWQEQLHAFEDDVRAWTGNTLEPLVRTHAELRRLAADGEPILRAWQEDGVLLHGHPLTSLLGGQATTSVRAGRSAAAARS